MGQEDRKQNVQDLRNLKSFDISVSRGFLRDPNPVLSLPREFEALDQIALVLPELNERGKLRKAVCEFPLIGNVDELEGPELNRAKMIYHFVQSSYVLAQGEEPVNIIPKQIAIPSYKLTKKSGSNKPILKYQDYALSNYRFHTPSKGFKIENIETILKFTRSKHENGFIRVHTSIEKNAAPILINIGNTKYNILHKSPVDVEMNLWKGARDTLNLVSILPRMWEECDINEYFKTVRPWIQKFDNIIYEGVEEFDGKPMSFRGETGAQSSVIPSIDNFLEIKHKENDLTRHLKDMLEYMPKNHKSFVELCSQGPSVRNYVMENKDNYPGLKDAFNSFVEALACFREGHHRFQHPYIISKIPGEVLGTGGTPFKNFLGHLIIETRASKVD